MATINPLRKQLPHHRRLTAPRRAAVVMAILLAWITCTSDAATDTKATLINLAQQFIQAQHDFDVAALARLTAPSYNEVSPLGALDPRDKMLSFYAPENKVPAPDVNLTDFVVQDLGNTGVVVAVMQIGPMPGSSVNATGRKMRVTLVAHHEGSSWKLIFLQCTAIREQAPGH